ncbi:MAG TPA: hypothetical protein ENK75_04075 [Saprospiraceae bacterium]|nr:hypothetical protein [Saprospiraceae bacterium]
MRYLKQFKIVFISITIILISAHTASSQPEEQGFRAGIKLPYTYDLGYFVRFNTRFAIHLSTQFVTFPFSKAPTGYMNFWGADPNITAFRNEPFSIGAGLDVGAHYYFGSDNRRYYGALSVQWMNLLKRDISDNVINKALDVDLNSGEIPLGPIAKSQSTKPLTLNTNYVNIGFIVGKIIPLLNPNTELRVEVGINKAVYSHHNLQSDYRYISPISELTNTKLQETMKKYGWFPTINVYYIYKISKF